jgi:hypothetical protein
MSNEILDGDTHRFVGVNVPTPDDPVHVVLMSTVEHWVKDMTQTVFTMCGKEVRIQWAGKMRMEEYPMCRYCHTFVEAKQI